MTDFTLFESLAGLSIKWFYQDRTLWMARPKATYTYPTLWACGEPVSYMTSGLPGLLMCISTENFRVLGICHDPWLWEPNACSTWIKGPSTQALGYHHSYLWCSLSELPAWAKPVFVRPAFLIWQASLVVQTGVTSEPCHYSIHAYQSSTSPPLITLPLGTHAPMSHQTSL